MYLSLIQFEYFLCMWLLVFVFLFHFLLVKHFVIFGFDKYHIQINAIVMLLLVCEYFFLPPTRMSNHLKKLETVLSV